MENSVESRWKFHGVRVVHGDELDIYTVPTPGMNRVAAITQAIPVVEKPEDEHWVDNIHPAPKA